MAAVVAKAAPIGTHGVLPDSTDNWAIETTVFTVGSPRTGWGAAVGVVHLLTWVAALAVIFASGNQALYADGAAATDSAKMLGSAYGGLVVAILVVVVLHAMFAKKEEMFWSTMASVVLLWLVFLELSLGCAYLAYSLTMNADFYNKAVVCHVLVCGGCAMVVTFYVNYTHNGNLNKRLGFGSDMGLTKNLLGSYGMGP